MDSLFPSPTAGFDHPLEVLDGCHERILRNCSAIERIAEHVRIHGCDTEARTAVVNVLRYFDTAVAHHHQDEEEDLFPALQQHAPSGELNAAFALIHKLRQDHIKLDSLWARMRALLMGVLEGHDGHLTTALALQFREAYERHIATEERELLPLARRVLDEDLMHALGARMGRRRGVDAQLAPGAAEPAQPGLPSMRGRVSTGQ
jgi:hemerythrin-like domain-containing protein